MKGAEIVLERETANDETALVVAIHTLSGALVEEDALLFDIENSKATQELRAPIAGVIVHSLQVGDNVAFGVPLARVEPSEKRSSQRVASPLASDAKPDIKALANTQQKQAVELADTVLSLRKSAIAPPVRFSKAASALMVELKLSPDQFTMGFVTREDILGRRSERHLPSVVEAYAGRAVPRETREIPLVGGVALSGRKRAEIEALGNGAGATHLSVLGKTIGPVSVSRHKGDFLQGKITDLVIYEASRLIRKYPNLNAHYSQGQIIRHNAVHAGMAIDRGGDLVVYGIENTDRLELHGVGIAISDAVARYMSNEVSAAEMTRSTFTITDLSGEALDFVFPLVPKGQSCIIGITRDDQANFRLFAGFDHRLSEGREVASFLNELVGRIRSFGEHEGAHPVVEPRCGTCDRLLSEAAGKSRDKGFLKIMDPQGREALCCASCWNGW